MGYHARMMTDNTTVTHVGDTEFGEILSRDGKFRYMEWAIWDDSVDKIMVIVECPLVATQSLIESARKTAGGIIIGYARSSINAPAPDSDILDIVGPHTHFWISEMAKSALHVIAAWGEGPDAYDGGQRIREAIPDATILTAELDNPLPISEIPDTLYVWEQ